MKQLKFLAVLALFLSFQFASAQERPVVKNWPQLKSVIEVTDRIEKNIKSDNKSAFRFATTLNQQVDEMIKAGAPKQYQNENVKATMDHLSRATKELATMKDSNVSNEDLSALFSKINIIVTELATLSTK